MSEETVAIVAIVGALMWWSLVLIPWRPWQTCERIEPDAVDTGSLLDDITVLIPARNESQYIRQTLQALHKQGKGIHVIVVDDQSVDDTATQAQENGARVIIGSTPPVGWSGKLWALEQGLREVDTPYVLLLDADIELMPGMVAALKTKAQQEKFALVSIMAEPPLAGIIERLLMPPFIYFFKLLYPFSLANKSSSPVAAAAGGCILVKTEALRATGAFLSLHDALIDDCTLAARIKQAGLKSWIGLSHSARIHRGYHNLKSVWEMVARTAYTQLQYSPVMLGICTLVMVCMFLLAPFAPFVLSSTEAFIICALAWIAMMITYFPILIYYRRSLLWGLTLPIAGILYLAMTWTLALRYWQGERANWKDRHYGSKPHH
jgi:hopene-associated glycosyltransferase HpnB